ncbi:UPF0294 protein YafD [Striga asiatica]|uniref:UPF0294 protein YafD n=1 Tax=Striga asiatica TaxID=4170 RepID=A0A5A7QXS0_STRAF|nr:UPF0294 protein YafD [Striga asiatica]
MIPSSANILEGPLRTKELKLLPGKERVGIAWSYPNCRAQRDNLKSRSACSAAEIDSTNLGNKVSHHEGPAIFVPTERKWTSDQLQLLLRLSKRLLHKGGDTWSSCHSIKEAHLQLEIGFTPAVTKKYAAWIFARLGSFPSACTLNYAVFPSITGFPELMNFFFRIPCKRKRKKRKEAKRSEEKIATPSRMLQITAFTDSCKPGESHSPSNKPERLDSLWTGTSLPAPFFSCSTSKREKSAPNHFHELALNAGRHENTFRATGMGERLLYFASQFRKLSPFLAPDLGTTCPVNKQPHFEAFVLPEQHFLQNLVCHEC